MPRKRLVAVLTSGVVLLAATAARAQNAPGDSPDADSLLRVGARVRLLESSGKERTLTGRVLGLDDQSLLLESREGKPPVEVQRAAIDRIQVSTGRHRQTRKGAIIGATALGLAGATLGAAVGVTECAYDGGHCGGWLATGAIVVGVPLGALGLGLGALLGSAFTVDDWQPVKARHVHAQLVPAQRGLGASVSFRF